MRFTDEQIRRLADRLLAAMVEKGGVRLKTERPQALARIEAIIRGNLGQEQSLDEEARELMEKHLSQAPPGMDRQKLFLMIKKKLAEEKGIPL
ncbi:MAG: DUF507 family protein [Desulfuromonadales bacterium]